MILTKELILRYLDKSNIEIKPISNLGLLVGRSIPGVSLLCHHGEIIGEIGKTYFSLEGNYYNFDSDYLDGEMVIKILRLKGLLAFL